MKTKWVYLNKTDAQGDITRKRARLVAKGFSQRYGIDYDEVFSPVAKYSTVRFILAMVAQEDLDMLQLDFKAAVLNGELEEEIYMEQPAGYINASHPDFVYQLLHAICGLKPASRTWHKLCDTFLKSIGFEQSKADSTFYMLVISGDTVYILVYVYDMLLVDASRSSLAAVADTIGKFFEIKIETKVAKFLGIVVERYKEKGEIQIHSATLIEHMLETFNMQNCRGVSNPLAPGTALPKLDQTEKKCESHNQMPYRQRVGSLLHLANTTGPDIAFATGYLSRFLEKPGDEHWQAAKLVLRYLSHTKAVVVTFSKWDNAGLHGYTDSDFAGDRESRKSVSGFLFSMEGGAVSSRSEKQDLTAQSTLEADFVAMSFAVREIVWLQRLFTDVYQRHTVMPIFGDNEGAMDLAYNDVVNERSKHIAVKYFFSKEKVGDGTCVFNYIPSTENTADIITKMLPVVPHKTFVKKMGMKQNRKPF